MWVAESNGDIGILTGSSDYGLAQIWQKKQPRKTGLTSVDIQVANCNASQLPAFLVNMITIMIMVLLLIIIILLNTW